MTHGRVQRCRLSNGLTGERTIVNLIGESHWRIVASRLGLQRIHTNYPQRSSTTPERPVERSSDLSVHSTTPLQLERHSVRTTKTTFLSLFKLKLNELNFFFCSFKKRFFVWTANSISVCDFCSSSILYDIPTSKFYSTWYSTNSVSLSTSPIVKQPNFQFVQVSSLSCFVCPLCRKSLSIEFVIISSVGDLLFELF